MPAFATFGTNEWAILFLVLVLGWLLGLISRSGGAKWRRAYEAERDARIDEQREHEKALAAADARIATLEAASTRPGVVTSVAPVATATPETLDLRRDDLSVIRGIGKGGERRLNAAGIYRYSEVANLSPADEEMLEQKLGADPGYIDQESWREQAKLLEQGKIDEHRARFS